MSEAVNWCIAVVAGFILGSLMQRSYTDDLEKEIRALKAESSPLAYVCPQGQVKLATRSDDGPWITRCVGPRGAK